MKTKYRVMASNENGENVVNVLFKSYAVAEVFYDNERKKEGIKETILDKVFFDENGELIENNDEGILAWREEDY